MVLLMLGMWLVSTLFYAFMLGFAILFIPWGFYTLNRRHHIHATRRAILSGGPHMPPPAHWLPPEAR